MLGGGVYLGWGNKQFSVMTSARYKTTRYLLGTLDTGGEYRPNFFDYQLVMSWRPSKQWSLDVLGNVADNHYNFVPHDRETRYGTMYDARSFKVYFDGQERDAFRTLFGAATLTRHFTPTAFLALQWSGFGTRERETYDIQGQYWLNEVTTRKQLGVGTYMEHARVDGAGDESRSTRRNEDRRASVARRIGLAQRVGQRTSCGVGDARFHRLFFAPQTECFAFDLRFAIDEPLGGAYHRGFFTGYLEACCLAWLVQRDCRCAIDAPRLEQRDVRVAAFVCWLYSRME
mgnify:CR=1 FL=1